MPKRIDYVPIQFGPSTVLVLKDKDLCLTVNTDYFQKCDAMVMNEKIRKAVENAYTTANRSKYGMNTLYLFVTDACNLNCEFCAMRSDQNNDIAKNWFRTELIEDKLLDLLKKLHPRRVIISGGEPLLHKDITQIIKKINESLDVKIKLQTNGTMMTEQLLDRIKGDIYSVEMSTSHYKSIESIENKLKLFAKYNVEAALTYVYEGNLQSLYNIVDLAAKYDTEFILNFVTLTGSALDQDYKVLSSNMRLDVYYQLVNYMLQKGYENKQLAMLFFTMLKPAKPCGALGNLMAIYPDGNMYMCHSLKFDKFHIGDIKTDGEEEIKNRWNELQNDSGVKELFRPDSHLDCKNCKFSPICSGVCAGEKYQKNKVICEHRKVLMLYQIQIYDQRKSIKDNLKAFLDFLEKKQYID